MGKRCKWYDPETGEPEKLSRSNESTICERCKRAGFTEKEASGIPEDQTTGSDLERHEEESLQRELQVDRVTILESSAEKSLWNIQGDLLVQLLKRRGSFWETISGLRTRWSITPKVGLPPAEFRPVYPPNCTEELSPEEKLELGSQWQRDLHSIVERFIPERFKFRGFSRGMHPAWSRFVRDCALFDPPKDKFLEFGLITGKGPALSYSDNSRSGADDELIVMKEPPIKRLRDADKVAAVLKDHYDEVISELYEFIDDLGERYLKPQGIDVHDLMKNTLEGPLPRVEKRSERLQQIWDESQQHISVDEHTTKKDVYNAFRVIAASQGMRPPAIAPKLDPVVCIDAALLHDEYDLSFKKLADRYGWHTDNSVRRIKNHVVRGRKILEEA